MTRRQREQRVDLTLRVLRDAIVRLRSEHLARWFQSSRLPHTPHAQGIDRHEDSWERANETPQIVLLPHVRDTYPREQRASSRSTETRCPWP